jgi:hypothetical protein
VAEKSVLANFPIELKFYDTLNGIFLAEYHAIISSGRKNGDLDSGMFERLYCPSVLQNLESN